MNEKYGVLHKIDYNARSFSKNIDIAKDIIDSMNEGDVLKFYGFVEIMRLRAFCSNLETHFRDCITGKRFKREIDEGKDFYRIERI